MKRFFTLVGLLLFTAALRADAAPATSTAPKEQVIKVPKVPEVELEQGIRKLLAIILGCDLDEMCSISMLNMMVKSDENYIFTTYLRLADLRKPEIEFNATICKTEQTQAVKKVLANCLSSSIGSLNSIWNFLKKDTEALTEQCVSKQLSELAESGNVYALAILAGKSLESGDTKNYQYWITSLRGQVKSSETANVQKCAATLPGAIKLFDETVHTVAKEQGIKIPE